MTGSDVPQSIAFINAIGASYTTAEIGSHLVRLAAAFGFSSVYGGLLPRGPTSRREIKPLTLIQHVPEEWGQRYNLRGYLFQDPVFHRLQHDPNPFTWTESYASFGGGRGRILVANEASAFGLTDGLVVPVATLDERIAAVSFGGDREPLDPDNAAKLCFAANFAIGRFLQLRASITSGPAHLTLRERECLLWSSEGKTDADIATIMGISVSTVSKHAASARDKLNAINKTHAVALAISLRML